jgi:IS1 family transposase
MNRLPIEKRAQIISLLTEGNSLRATSRIVGCSINTVTKLLLDVGEACAAYQDEHLRDLPCRTVEADEIWSFVAHKERNKPEELKGTFGTGDVWTWTAIDADTKLICSWYVGARTREDAAAFLADLKERLRGRIQLTTDAHRAYESSVGLIFKSDIDWAQLHKEYASPREGQARYSPAVCVGTRRAS